ncbi:hypothetical protein KI694_01760 [Enterobacter oligotrophicus]|nr:hypothetical protein [Enterobacter oligotrophicus]
MLMTLDALREYAGLSSFPALIDYLLNGIAP